MNWSCFWIILFIFILLCDSSIAIWATTTNKFFLVFFSHFRSHKKWTKIFVNIYLFTVQNYNCYECRFDFFSSYRFTLILKIVIHNWKILIENIQHQRKRIRRKSVFHISRTMSKANRNQKEKNNFFFIKLYVPIFIGFDVHTNKQLPILLSNWTHRKDSTL